MTWNSWKSCMSWKSCNDFKLKLHTFRWNRSHSMEYTRPQLLKLAHSKEIPNPMKLTSRQLMHWLLLIHPLPLPTLNPSVYHLNRPVHATGSWSVSNLTWYFDFKNGRCGPVQAETVVKKLHKAGFIVVIPRPQEGDILRITFGNCEDLYFVYNDILGQSWLAPLDRFYLPQEASFYLQYWNITTQSMLRSLYGIPFKGILINGEPQTLPE